MTEMTTETPKPRARGGAMGIGALIAACIGCCSLPLVASASIAGVAICSTRFLGVAFSALFAVAATAALIVYRKRNRRLPASIAVELGTARSLAGKS